MGYLDDNGLTRLWSKIKTYVLDHHKTVSTTTASSGNTRMTFGDTFSYPNLYQIAACDDDGHVNVKVTSPGFTLPNVECGTVTMSNGAASITLTKLQHSPKIIKAYYVDVTFSDEGLHHFYNSDFSGNDGNVINKYGTITNVSKDGFRLAGAPGTYVWEAWADG